MPLLDTRAWQPRRLAGAGYTVTEPATGQALGTLALATPEDVGAASGRAATAQHAWARTPRRAC